MKNPLLFLAYHDYMSRVIRDGCLKDIKVISEEHNKGFIYYEVNGQQYNIPPISNPEGVIKNTIAGLLINEGYTIVNGLEGTYVVSNNNGDRYFVTGNSCTCPDRYNPCKHMLFRDWYESFRRDQVKLLHNTIR